MNAVHVIIRRVGTYEYTETPIRAFATAAAARRFIKRANAEWAEAESAVEDRIDYPADNAPDAEWEKWARRRKRQWARFRSFLKCDKAAGPTGEWESPDEPSYYSYKVPLDSDSGSDPKGEDSRSEAECGASQSGRSEAEASPK